MIYIKVFVKIYYWRSKKLVQKTYIIIKYKKYPILKAKNTFNPNKSIIL